jgi:hypothetical protein
MEWKEVADSRLISDIFFDKKDIWKRPFIGETILQHFELNGSKLNRNFSSQIQIVPFSYLC